MPELIAAALVAILQAAQTLSEQDQAKVKAALAEHVGEEAGIDAAWIALLPKTA